MSATSPTAEATSKVVTSQDFGRYIKYFQDSHKAIVKWNSILTNAPPSGITIKATEDGESDTVLRKSDIAKYSQIFIAELGDLKKIYANKKQRKTSRNNSQLRSLFYVSDQLAAFYSKANLGPIDPSTGKGKLADKLSIITEKRMATSGILMSLFARYIQVNGLKTESGRFKPDARIKKAFATSNFRLNSTDVSKRKLPASVPQEKVDAVKEKIQDGKKSALARISERSESNGRKMYDEDEGLLYTSMCTLNNFYRIPTVLLTESEKQELLDPSNIEEARELQEILTQIKNFK
jgi:hypothetical protein